VASSHVLRVNDAEEENAFRRAVHEVISLILAEKPGRTLIDIGETIGVTTKTVSNAYNMTHSLSEMFLRRLGQAYGTEKLDPWARLIGARMVPLHPTDRRDILPFLTRASAKIAEARDPQSPGGEREIHTERFGYLASLRDLGRELEALITEIEGERERLRAA
jgi:plasmid maintenance system antidote protein VapI